METATIEKALSRNKKVFLEYNNFRKKLFSEMAPKDSEIILYLLPWLLSVNDALCPGYVPDLAEAFRVFDIEYVKEIKAREEDFKKRFGIHKKGSLIKVSKKGNIIQGIYTIGSAGTVNQNATSDCDIWICFDKKTFSKSDWIHLNQKVNLIKGWLDDNIKIPVYFFVSDIQAVKEGRFGSVDQESSGSTQENVLKEEFYRTFILISGKIPLWWLAYDKNEKVDYQQALEVMENPEFWEYDIIDLGNIEKIKSTEYFGAALWQFHKFLTSPLKSIIKMVLLKMLLEAPEESLLCHQLREAVLSGPNTVDFPDHSIFTMTKILNNYKGRKKELMNFLKMCFFLRCENKHPDARQTLRNKLTGNFFKEHPLDPESMGMLKDFDSLSFQDQIQFGERLFKYMLTLYREIAEGHEQVSSESDKRDLTILGRKISVGYLKKSHKISILQKPTKTLNLSILTFSLNNDTWYTFSGNEKTPPIFSSRNIIENIAFLVWNNLFVEHFIRMRPNPSSITQKEIINLARRIQEFFGTYETADIDLANYLKEEKIIKMLIVMDFDKSPWDEKTNDFGIVFMNNWGELFTRRFTETSQVETFLRETCADNKEILISKYLRRNSSSFEKNIALPKRNVFSTIEF
jgi:adenylate cyclase class 1